MQHTPISPVAIRLFHCVPEQLFEMKIVRPGNGAVTKVLVKWNELDEDKARWEFLKDFH